MGSTKQMGKEKSENFDFFRIFLCGR